MDLDKLNQELASALALERNLVAQINELGASDSNPRRDSPTADKIRELDQKRAAARQKWRDLKALRADLAGELEALARHRKGKGVTAMAKLQAARTRLASEVTSEGTK